jgi:hypothetical protein
MTTKTAKTIQNMTDNLDITQYPNLFKTKTENASNALFEAFDEMLKYDKPIPDMSVAFSESLNTFENILKSNLDIMKDKINFFKEDIAIRDIIKPTQTVASMLNQQFSNLMGPAPKTNQKGTPPNTDPVDSNRAMQKKSFDEEFDEAYK